MAGISVIIPIGNGYEGRAMPERWDSLAYSINNFYGRHQGIELIIVHQNCAIPQTVTDSLKHSMSGDGRAYKTIPLKYKTFNKGWCCNVGVRAAKHKDIIIAESDMFGTKAFLSNVCGSHTWCFAWNKLVVTSREQRDEILKGGISYLDNGKKIIVPRKGMSEGGFVYFNKNFYLAIGGFNEWFEKLGGLDNEIIRRAESVTKDYPKFPVTVYHLWHPLCRELHCASRDKNKRILRSTRALPGEFIKMLRKLNFGNIKAPQCALQTFQSAWSKRNA